MPRKAKVKIKFTSDSVNELAQEIYDESFALRAKMKSLFGDWETHIKDGGDVALIGTQLVKVIDAMGKNQDRKLQLLKIIKEIVFIDSKIEGGAPASNVDRDKVKEVAAKALKDYEDLSGIDSDN